MNQRWIFGTLIVLSLGGLTAAIVSGPRGDWDRHDRTEVVRVVDSTDGATTGSGDTIIVERGRGFFPFGIFLIPLLLLLFFGFFGRAFRDGRPWGPNGGPPSSQWLDEWHRLQHQQNASPEDDANRPSTS